MGHRTVFFGNIYYECTDEELNQTLRTVGPYRDFKPIGDEKKPKGFGFCTYNDPDTAASSIRNLDKLSLKSRDLKVHFANDKQSEHNLKMNEVKYRDASEIINGAGSIPTHHTMAQGQGLQMVEVLNPTNSSVDDMIRNLSDRQKEMIIFGIQDVCNQRIEQPVTPGANGAPKSPVIQPKELLVEALAKDENMLMQLEEICNQVIKNLRAECAEHEIWINDTYQDHPQQQMYGQNPQNMSQQMMQGGTMSHTMSTGRYGGNQMGPPNNIQMGGMPQNMGGYR